jgi:hypothetical protein
MKTCTECGRNFHPWRDRMFGHEQTTCGEPDCQRARKSRLQRERRLRVADFDRLRQSRPTVPQIAGKATQRPAVKQRRSSLLQKRRGA